MSFTIAYKTNAGRTRTDNEDSYAVLNRTQLDGRLDALFVVADGMGGGHHGDVASGIVAQTVPESVVEFLTSAGSAARLDEQMLMRDSITRANTIVWMRQVENSDLHGMGTTVVAGMLRSGKLTVGHAGDSRAYLLREGKLRQLTDDHSQVWEQVKRGVMTREQARLSKHRNAITRGIGISTSVTPDVETVDLLDGDTVLLCSDGLTTELSDVHIARILAAAPDAQIACDNLVDAALSAGGRDNITVIVVRYGTFVSPAAEDVVALAPEVPAATGEDDTDDNPPTRRAGGRAKSGVRFKPTFEDGQSPLDDEEDERARNVSGFASAVIVLALFVIIGLSVALNVALKNRTVVNAVVDAGPPQNANPVQVSAPPHLKYLKPSIVAARVVLRDEPLTLTPAGELLAVGQEGSVYSIRPDGSAKRFAGSPIGPAAPTGPSAVYFALDSAGNRYQSDPARRVIDKFTPDGVRIASDIGRGGLHNPQAIAVTPDGSTIYVIDSHVLKRMSAAGPVDQTASRTLTIDPQR